MTPITKTNYVYGILKLYQHEERLISVALHCAG